jgi:hypothetical protein
LQIEGRMAEGRVAEVRWQRRASVLDESQADTTISGGRVVFWFWVWFGGVRVVGAEETDERWWRCVCASG